MHQTSTPTQRESPAAQPKATAVQTSRKGKHGQRFVGRWPNWERTVAKGDGWTMHGSPEQSTVTSSGSASSSEDLARAEVRAEAMPDNLKETLLVGLPMSAWFECPVVDVVFSDEGDGQAFGRGWMPQNAPGKPAVELMAQLPSGGAGFPVSAEDVRLPPHSSATELFVPRIGAFAEYRILEPLPGWVPCRVIRRDSRVEMAEIELDNGDVLAVAESLLRGAGDDAGLRSLDSIGGVVRESLEVPLDNWDFDENLEDQIEDIKRKAKPFKVIISRSEGGTPSLITIIGLPSSVARCKALLNNFFKSTRPAHQTQERRERRLKLLAERREAYDGACVLEFHVEESLIGLIIGRQGEKLSRVAKDFQVELRVLPDEDGARRVRVYGPTMQLINRAREELELVYQFLTLEPVTYETLTSERLSQLRDLSQKSGLHASWLDPAKHALIIWGSRRCLESFRLMLDGLLKPHNTSDIRSGHRQCPIFQANEYPSSRRKNSFRPSYADWDSSFGQRSGRRRSAGLGLAIQPLWNSARMYGEDFSPSSTSRSVPFTGR